MPDTHSETPEALRKARLDYVDTVWKNMAKSQFDVSMEIMKALFTLNLTAAGAMLAFMAAMQKVRELPWAKWSLGFFVLGLVVLLTYWSVNYHVQTSRFRRFQSATKDYYSNAIEWASLTDVPNVPVKIQIILTVQAYAVAVCWIVGVGIATYNLI